MTNDKDDDKDEDDPPVKPAPKKSSFFVWVFLLSAGSCDKLISGLVRRDYSVEPGHSDGRIPVRNGDRPSVMLLLRVMRPEDSEAPATSEALAKDIDQIIDRNQIKIFGLVIAPSLMPNDCRCSTTNILFSKEKPTAMGTNPVPVLQLVRAKETS